MYLPPLLQLRPPPNDPRHRLCPATAASVVHIVVPGVSAVLGASVALCYAVVLEVETAAAVVMPEAVAD